MSSRKQGEYRNQRFDPANDFQKYVGPYQFDSNELHNLEQQGIQRIHSQVLDLTTAQSPKQPLEVNISGRAFKLKGINTQTGAVYDIVANTGIEVVNTTAQIGAWLNQPGVGNLNRTDYLIIKSGDGYRGDFMKLFLFWPAQANVQARLTIFKFDDTPWTSGDSST